MGEVGVRWHNGTLAIAQEHLVSEMQRSLLGSMMRLFRPSNPAMKMVLATLSGESHEFGILVDRFQNNISTPKPWIMSPASTSSGRLLAYY